MAYGKVAQERKSISDVLTATGNFESINGVSRYTETVDVKNYTGGCIGAAMVFDTDAYVPYVAQTLTGAKVAILVGDERGAGFNTADVAITTTAKKMTALTSGEAAILLSGVEFANGADEDAFVAALEAQGIRVAPEAPVVTPSYI